MAWISTDTGYLGVWEDWRSYGGAGRTDLYGRLIEADGTPLAKAFRISRPADIYDDREPAVAWDKDRNEYLAVWRAGLMPTPSMRSTGSGSKEAAASPGYDLSLWGRRVRG